VKISVAMCTYNGVRHLGEQLASIAGQTRPPDELVVCDDCSGDATAGIVREFAAAASFPVRLYVNDRNLGSTRNFEQAIGRCGGDLIALADQDDVWHPDKLRRAEAALAGAPGAGAYFSDAEVVDEGLRPLGYTVWEFINFGPRQREAIGRGRAFEVLSVENYVTGATLCFRSKFRRLVLPITEFAAGRVLIHDGWIVLLISAVADVVCDPQPLVKYRQHPGQQMGASAAALERRAASAGGGRGGGARLENFDLPALGQLAAVFGRLAEADEFSPYKPDALRMRSQFFHLRARAGLPESRLSRLPTVLRELFSARYHRYSNGVLSAAKDLLL